MLPLTLQVYVNDLDSVPDCAVRLGWAQALGKGII